MSNYEKWLTDFIYGRNILYFRSVLDTKSSETKSFGSIMMKY